MSAANFELMRDFPLFTKDYVSEVKRCPVCGTVHYDLGSNICEVCGCEELEDSCEFDEFACADEWEEITSLLDDFNQELMFHKVKLQSGYYNGVQFIVETEHDLDECDYDNDDCHYYFDCCRSVAHRKYAAEVRKINRKLAALGKSWGFTEMVCVAHFSNGEACYAPTSNSRARLYSAVA